MISNFSPRHGLVAVAAAAVLTMGAGVSGAPGSAEAAPDFKGTVVAQNKPGTGS